MNTSARPSSQIRDATLVIVPAFNESVTIGKVIDDLVTAFPKVVIVDDGSSDTTSSIAKSRAVDVVRHPINLGQGAAIMTGIAWGLRSTDFETFATFDADGQHQVDDLVSTVELLRASSVDVVLGSRFLGDDRGVPRAKRLMLKFATMQSRMVTRLKLTDTHNGLRAFTRVVASSVELSNGMSHASDFLWHVAREHYSVMESPTTILYTEYSKAKGQPMINAVNILFDSLTRNR